MIAASDDLKFSNIDIFLSLLDHVEEIKNQKDLIDNCLSNRTMESLLLRKKKKSLKSNFIYAYSLILNTEYRKNPSYSIVDLCSGLGFLTQLFRKKYNYVVGLDFNDNFLNHSRKISISKDLPIEYLKFDINNFPYLNNVFILYSIFGINVAKDTNDVIKKILNVYPEYIIILDGNSKNIYSKIKLFFGIQTRDLDFSFIENCFGDKYQILLKKNIHTTPSFLIDIPLIGAVFEYLNRCLRKFDLFAASVLLIAEKKYTNDKQ